MTAPKRVWWARPRKLCALERPGGGGRSHRPERRADEIEWLKEANVRLVISCMDTGHNLGAYDDAGLDWIHVPGQDEAAFEELLVILRRETRKAGAVAIHGNRHTDFVAALCAAHLAELKDAPPAEFLREAAEAGLMVTPECERLLSR